MGSFNCEWDTGRVAFEDGYAKLTIAENPDGSEADCNEYFGGEMRTRGYYGYGDYEVSMKPAKKVGTASTFFVCTGDYDYQPGSSTPNPWDEVDIEFLGQDTTKVQFNYFVNGVGTGVHEYVYDLGFDASEDFHTYGFRWAEDHITWFVDGEPVYRVDASADNPMPSTAGRMLMNYWCGNSKGYGWMGQYSDPGDEGAEYQWIKTSAAKAYDESEAGPPAETPDIEGVDFTDVDMSAVGAASDAVYAVTKAEDAFNVTYADLAGNYQNVAFTGMDTLAQANNLFRAEITNNGEQAVGVRIDVMSTEEVNEPAPDQFMYVTNLLAMQDGVAVTTDLEWGGSLFTVEAGATVEIVIEYDNSYPYSNIQFMIDSHLADGLTHSGNVTIGGFAFGANDNASTEVRPPEPSENSMISFSTDHEYVISEAGVPSEEVNITYSGVKNDYHCVYGAITTADTQGKNTFTFTVVNNSADKPVEFRIDLQNASGTNVVTAISSPASWSGGDGNFYFRVAAGATETITVTFSDSLTGVLLYIDSTIYIEGDDAHTTTYSGDITLKDFKFTNVA
ncbi:MAG TPA: family 16 glycosylhydrolase [Candidatus Coproplasma avistercoris]|nr:family 16 glycosylhydrolase [Candidatus Coproplasma avistercoris]